MLLLLDVEPYVVSRLLGKLESARYVTRTRHEGDKLVALTERTEHPHSQRLPTKSDMSTVIVIKMLRNSL